MTAPVTPRRGLRFEHARFRQDLPGVKIADCPPEVCRVTRVVASTEHRVGVVYYRTGDGTGMRWKVGADEFPASVGRVL